MKFTCPSLSSRIRSDIASEYVLLYSYCVRIAMNAIFGYVQPTHIIENAAYVRNNKQKIRLKSHEIQM